MMTPSANSACPAIRRDLHDGTSYQLTAGALGATAVSVHDASGDITCIGLDRAGVRQLIDDLELVAGLRPTSARIPLEEALTGTARRLFERLEDLDKQNPAAADRIVAALTAHLRSWRPVLLAGAQP